ncbi:MAG TPA: Bax inhibitor-1/YccA family protein [Caulobacterales bacterium]|nr:Bax inhibitor-1/YccA family protein [Caulobacterales bacterium]
MSDWNSQARVATAGRADMAVDAGLRGFMLGVFNKMGLGLLLSAALAYVTGTVPAVAALVFGTPLYFVVLFGPLAILLISSFALRNPSPTAANIIYWAVVSLIGISLGSIVIVYGRLADGLITVAKAFLITAASFGALSLWGYTTKKDLSGFGTFLIMGVVGLVIASIVNMFIHSSALGFAISAIGVLVFAGLTAFDTQRLKYMYYQVGGDARGASVATTYGALSLYLDFINLFLFILRLMSPRN